MLSLWMTNDPAICVVHVCVIHVYIHQTIICKCLAVNSCRTCGINWIYSLHLWSHHMTPFIRAIITCIMVCCYCCIRCCVNVFRLHEPKNIYTDDICLSTHKKWNVSMPHLYPSLLPHPTHGSWLAVMRVSCDGHSIDNFHSLMALLISICCIAMKNIITTTSLLTWIICETNKLSSPKFNNFSNVMWSSLLIITAKHTYNLCVCVCSRNSIIHRFLIVLHCFKRVVA